MRVAEDPSFIQIHSSLPTSRASGLMWSSREQVASLKARRDQSRRIQSLGAVAEDPALVGGIGGLSEWEYVPGNVPCMVSTPCNRWTQVVNRKSLAHGTTNYIGQRGRGKG